MPEPKQKSRTGIIIAAIICSTLLFAGGIGAFVYVSQQNLAQQKELKEAEIKAQNERAQRQRETEEENSKRDCRAKAIDSWAVLRC